MSKSPSVIMKEKFGDKKKLVEAVQQFVNDDLWLAHSNKGKGLAHVSNAKLLRLLDTFQAVKAKWGKRDALIDAILVAEGRQKDATYRQHLVSHPVPRLYDKYKSASRKQKTDATAKKAPVAAKKAAPAAAVAAAPAAAAPAAKKDKKKSPAKAV